MAFDFKKEFKEFYMPKNKPEIVTVIRHPICKKEVMLKEMKEMGI